MIRGVLVLLICDRMIPGGRVHSQTDHSDSDISPGKYSIGKYRINFLYLKPGTHDKSLDYYVKIEDMTGWKIQPDGCGFLLFCPESFYRVHLGSPPGWIQAGQNTDDKANRHGIGKMNQTLIGEEIFRISNHDVYEKIPHNKTENHPECCTKNPY